MRKYDLAFGIGGACCCTQALRHAKLQHASFPWDWIACSDIRTRANQWRDNFVDWLVEDRLTKQEINEYRAGAVYRNELTQMVFAHDFPLHGSLAADFPRVQERYRRRIAHLRRLFGNAASVLVVWVDVPACPKATEDDLRHALEVFRAGHPSGNVDLLAFANEPGRDMRNAGDEESGGIRRVAFDYRDYREGDQWVADNRLLGKWLRERYAVPDYRTEEEKRNYRRICREKEYGRYGAKNLGGYLVNKIEYKIYNHFMKRLRRKGVI